MTDRSEALFNCAEAIIPGGISSPVRAFGSVGDVPRFVEKAQGTYVWDKSGTRYADYIGSWGSVIVGRAHPEVIEAVREATLGGLSFGTPIETEVVIAEETAEPVPSIEQLRLVSPGTEATVSIIHLTCGFTGCDKIIKFEGCYRDHSGDLPVKAGSGLLTFSNPSSVGMSADSTKHALALEYNNTAQLEEMPEKTDGGIAHVIIEPSADNMNLVRPSGNFVRALRSLSAKHGAVLVYDEVMTGFRVVFGGAQSLHGITPDLTTMGRIIGGGMPLAAFDGRRDITACIPPLGSIYRAGTLSGNPVAVAAGLKTLEAIQCEGFYENLIVRTEQLAKGLQIAAAKAGVASTANSVGGMFDLYFTDHVPQNYGDMMRSNTDGFKHLFHGMLERGVAFGLSAYEADFVSAAHTPELIDETVTTAEAVSTGTIG